MIVAGFDVGGKNIHGVIRGFVDSLKREIGMEVMVPADPRIYRGPGSSRYGRHRMHGRKDRSPNRGKRRYIR